MKRESLLTYCRAILTAIVLLAGINVANAQTPTYELYLANETQVNTTTYQFDIYILRTGATPLEMAAFQFGLGIDVSSIPAGATLTPSIVGGFSDLAASQVPNAVNFGT